MLLKQHGKNLLKNGQKNICDNASFDTNSDAISTYLMTMGGGYFSPSGEQTVLCLVL